MPIAAPYALLFPSGQPRLLEWCIENMVNFDGDPYSHEDYPHLGAPNGPCDAFDDPEIREIWLQFASRLGKTFFGQCCQLYTADVNPAPQMFATSTEKLATEVVARTYFSAERCPTLKHQLRAKGNRRQDQIIFASSRIFVGWSRSVSTLADKDAKIGHATEIDKWEQASTSKEADPLKLFDDRFKNVPAHKKIKDSTPAKKGESRVEAGRLQADNRQFWVPCIHCGRYQTLRKGDGKEPGGIAWDKGPSGRSDKISAFKTARYVCRHCAQPLLDHHRAPMVRAGVWVPEGCEVDDERARYAAANWPGINFARRSPEAARLDYLVGTPHRAGREASFQLSSLAALKLGWGAIAAEWVGCTDDPEKRRNFINQWLAETWEAVHSKSTWQQLGERLIVPDRPHATVPEGFSLVTCAIDKQKDFYVFVVLAWSPAKSSHVISYGWADTLDELLDEVILCEYPHADGGPKLRPAMTLVDSGFEPKEPYEFSIRCQKKGLAVLPCKGAATSLNGPYTLERLGKKTSMPGLPVVRVDSFYTQDWIERKLHYVRPGEDGCMSVFTLSLIEHQDFLEQLLNEALVASVDKHGREHKQWEKIQQKQPNDYRACARYNIPAMLLATRGGPIRPRGQKPAPRVVAPMITTPDGRPFCITERI